MYHGHSGAAKTTLLNVLARRSQRNLEISGQICLNGVSIEEFESLSKVVGYVQQTNVLPDCLTVEEQLTMTVKTIFYAEQYR